MQYLLKALNKYSQRFLVFQKISDWRTKKIAANAYTDTDPTINTQL